ncbi:hypothetical protein [Xanthomarina spongicola]|uniref:Uncharacterized protein n=1 Tax=Xanthomarina spongicola TaxID=570520 RepID=A0A316DN62_9FLAO|nr:hypothetical protein [Xanthomarina spongicola]PWK18998.1 hypothetical protein LX78_01475 [Xanthomarina spongicola]
MKSLTITLLVALFCVTVSGVNLKDTEPTKISKENSISTVDNFEYDFGVNRHVRKGGSSVPSNG